MNFPTLPYDNVTYSFLLEIWFWGPFCTMSLFWIFFFELIPNGNSKTFSFFPLREAFKKKKTEKSDIVQKGRVGWTPKSYF